MSERTKGSNEISIDFEQHLTFEDLRRKPKYYFDIMLHENLAEEKRLKPMDKWRANICCLIITCLTLYLVLQGKNIGTFRLMEEGLLTEL